MKDIRSPAAIRRAEQKMVKEAKGRTLLEQRRMDRAHTFWGKLRWQKIASCPFKEYEYEQIFVTDGKRVCIAKVSKRFGTPMRVVEEPEMVLTDKGMAWQGGKYEEIKAPKWWFQWELEDVNGSMTYAGGHETGREEVPFIATHWMPMPPGFKS